MQPLSRKDSNSEIKETFSEDMYWEDSHPEKLNVPWSNYFYVKVLRVGLLWIMVPYPWFQTPIRYNLQDIMWFSFAFCFQSRNIWFMRATYTNNSSLRWSIEFYSSKITEKKYQSTFQTEKCTVGHKIILSLHKIKIKTLSDCILCISTCAWFFVEEKIWNVS